MVSNPIAMASNLKAMASNLIAMASNPIAMASNLQAGASRKFSGFLVVYHYTTSSKKLLGGGAITSRLEAIATSRKKPDPDSLQPPARTVTPWPPRRKNCDTESTSMVSKFN